MIENYIKEIEDLRYGAYACWLCVCFGMEPMHTLCMRVCCS